MERGSVESGFGKRMSGDERGGRENQKYRLAHRAAGFLGEAFGFNGELTGCGRPVWNCPCAVALYSRRCEKARNCRDAEEMLT
jgi:hypothetical protein